MSYAFSDSTDQNIVLGKQNKNTLDSNGLGSNESNQTAKEFEKKLNAVMPYKFSGNTVGFSSQQTFKEDSSIVEFKDHSNLGQRDRKLTTIDKQPEYCDESPQAKTIKPI
jgi:hypothetical protein